MNFFVLLFPILVFAVSGCASTVWLHRDHSSQARFDQDQRECQYDSVKYGQAQGYYQTGVGAGFADAMRKNEVLMACMQSKGYYLENRDKAREIRAQESQNQMGTAAPKQMAAETLAELLGARLKKDYRFGLYYAGMKTQERDIIVMTTQFWDELGNAERKALIENVTQVYNSLCYDIEFPQNTYYLQIHSSKQ